MNQYTKQTQLIITKRMATAVCVASFMPWAVVMHPAQTMMGICGGSSE